MEDFLKSYLCVDLNTDQKEMKQTYLANHREASELNFQILAIDP